MLMAGASSAWATGYPMTNAGATVLLGGSLVPQDGVWADVYEYPRCAGAYALGMQGRDGGPLEGS